MLEKITKLFDRYEWTLVVFNDKGRLISERAETRMCAGIKYLHFTS